MSDSHAPKNISPQRWYHWIIPRRSRYVLIRMTVLTVLLLLFQNYVLTWTTVGHDYLWRWRTGSARHHADDVRYLMYLGTPGQRQLGAWGQEEAWAEATDAKLIPRLLQIARDDARATVRAAAISGLTHFWDERVPRALSVALTDSEPKVRRTSADAIGTLNLHELAPALNDSLEREGDAYARQVMSRVMVQLESDPAVKPVPADRISVKVAAIQFRSEFAQPELNRKRLETYIRQAAAGGAKFVVLPESAITGYTSQDLRTTWQTGRQALDAQFRHGIDPSPYAETVPGPSTDAFGKLSQELKIYLTIPLLEKGPGEKFYNTILLTGPDGQILAHYRKLNPWRPAECAWASIGDHGLPVVDTPYGRMGLIICHDINFEPLHLRDLKVDTLLYCIAWVDRPQSTWFHVDLPRIARNCHLNIIGANWTIAEKSDWCGYGQSLIIDYDGRVLARASQDIGEEIIYGDVPARQP